MKMRSSTSGVGVVDFGGVLCKNMVYRSVSMKFYGRMGGPYRHTPPYTM